MILKDKKSPGQRFWPDLSEILYPNGDPRKNR
jgi:hypothetical protein